MPKFEFHLAVVDEEDLPAVQQVNGLVQYYKEV